MAVLRLGPESPPVVAASLPCGSRPSAHTSITAAGCAEASPESVLPGPGGRAQPPTPRTAQGTLAAPRRALLPLCESTQRWHRSVPVSASCSGTREAVGAVAGLPFNKTEGWPPLEWPLSHTAQQQVLHQPPEPPQSSHVCHSTATAGPGHQHIWLAPSQEPPNIEEKGKGPGWRSLGMRPALGWVLAQAQEAHPKALARSVVGWGEHTSLTRVLRSQSELGVAGGRGQWPPSGVCVGTPHPGAQRGSSKDPGPCREEDGTQVPSSPTKRAHCEVPTGGQSRAAFSLCATPSLEKHEIRRPR